jgi:thioredoxin reductase
VVLEVVTVADAPGDKSLDVVVIGGGAAGLNGALMLARSRRSVLVIDSEAPRNAPAEGVHGLLGRDGMSPVELLERGRTEVRGYGGQVVAGEVHSVSRDENAFAVALADGRSFGARRVLVASGLVDELPDLPGLRARWGRDVLHCPYCHGWEVRDQALGVLGTRPDAVQHALLIRQWSTDVIFFDHTLDLGADDLSRLDASGVRVVHGTVARLLVEDDQLTGVGLDDGRVVPRAAVFIRPTNVPHADGLLAGLGCDLDPVGFPVVDGAGRTSCPGVWAAGNVVDPRSQVITSAGAGSAAAIAMNADLVRDDVDRAIELGRATSASIARA